MPKFGGKGLRRSRCARRKCVASIDADKAARRAEKERKQAEKEKEKAAEKAAKQAEKEREKAEKEKEKAAKQAAREAAIAAAEQAKKEREERKAAQAAQAAAAAQATKEAREAKAGEGGVGGGPDAPGSAGGAGGSSGDAEGGGPPMPPLKRGRGRPRKDPSQPGYSGRGRGRGGSGAPLLPLGPGEFIGMRWRVAVEGRPVGAVELACSALAEALAGGKLEFTKEDIEGIGLQGQTLEALSCIASDGRWYTPDLPLPPGAAAAPVAAPAPPPPPPPPPKPPPEPVGPQWGSEEDSELLRGIYKHGFGAYEEVSPTGEARLRTGKYRDMLDVQPNCTVRPRDDCTWQRTPVVCVPVPMQTEWAAREVAASDAAPPAVSDAGARKSTKRGASDAEECEDMDMEGDAVPKKTQHQSLQRICEDLGYGEHLPTGSRAPAANGAADDPWSRATIGSCVVRGLAPSPYSWLLARRLGLAASLASPLALALASGPRPQPSTPAPSMSPTR